MKIGIAMRKNDVDYFVHQSYIHMLKELNHTFDFITLETNLKDFEGFLLPGGYDLSPNLYHQKNYASYHVDEEMDLLDKKIIDYAVKTKKPLLGICRGIQSINVFLGGSLKQDISHHQNENHFILWKGKYILVNSFHHQSIDKLGVDLVAEAKSLDGEIEIIRHKALPIFGVQFHPELFPFQIRNFFSEF